MRKKDVHESQFVLETTFTQIFGIQFFFWKNIYILFFYLFLWIVSNVT